MYFVHLDIDNNKVFVVDWLKYIYQVDHKVMIDMDLIIIQIYICFLIKIQLNLLLASVHKVPFHSGKQWQRKPFSKSVHVPLFAHGCETHSSNSNNIIKLQVIFFHLFILNKTTLITCRSEKTRITLTSKWIRCIRNTSTMLITYIRRAYYMKNEYEFK